MITACGEKFQGDNDQCFLWDGHFLMIKMINDHYIKKKKLLVCKYIHSYSWIICFFANFPLYCFACHLLTLPCCKDLSFLLVVGISLTFSVGEVYWGITQVDGVFCPMTVFPSVSHSLNPFEINCALNTELSCLSPLTGIVKQMYSLWRCLKLVSRFESLSQLLMWAL